MVTQIQNESEKSGYRSKTRQRKVVTQSKTSQRKHVTVPKLVREKMLPIQILYEELTQELDKILTKR